MQNDLYLGPAVVLTAGLFRTRNGKTAHGLVRETKRFKIVGVIDPAEPLGLDAGEVLDGRHRGIPFFPDLDSALSLLPSSPRYAIVGIATHGGRITPELRAYLQEALEKGFSLVNGLHDFANDDPELVALAKAKNLQIIDIRRPKPRSELHFWEGHIQGVRAPRVAILGTDCNIGKRTTSRFLLNECLKQDLKAELIYTGQTGWMQGSRYGFILDSVPNDFVSGELEQAIVQCDLEQNPDLILLEGQSSFFNPSGPCGAEFLLSAQAQGVILQHAPGRTFFEGYEEQQLLLPPLEKVLDLITHYGVPILAITLNQEDMTMQALREYKRQLEQKISLPVLLPLSEDSTEGLSFLIPLLRQFCQDHYRRDQKGERTWS